MGHGLGEIELLGVGEMGEIGQEILGSWFQAVRAGLYWPREERGGRSHHALVFMIDSMTVRDELSGNNRIGKRDHYGQRSGTDLRRRCSTMC